MNNFHHIFDSFEPQLDVAEHTLSIHMIKTKSITPDDLYALLRQNGGKDATLSWIYAFRQNLVALYIKNNLFHLQNPPHQAQLTAIETSEISPEKESLQGLFTFLVEQGYDPDRLAA